MASSSEYVIYRPEKLRISDVFSFLVFGRSLEGSEVIESNSSRVHGSHKVDGVGVNLITFVTLILQKILIWISGPMALLGLVVEFVLNLLSLNGGLLKLFAHLFTGKLVIPNKDAANYRSILGHIDGRTDLNRVSTILSHLPGMEPLNRISEINPVDLTIMAAKIAYENKAFVEEAVTNHWNMHFVGHYQFYNESLKTEDTQAFVCCDRRENAQLIVVAFRGTEPFSGRDWSTDVDLSWMSMGELGRVHVGFMKALGLQNEKDYKKGWPKDYTGTKKLAYYSLRDTLKVLLQANRGARIIVTGHSLGGALAILFPAVLVLLGEEEIMSRLLGVYTFGQPRVGDKTFGDYMKGKLNGIFKRYHRVVFRYDIVPRVPFDDKIMEFAHFGGCLYYKSWYKGKVMVKEPDQNYFNPFYIPSKYLNAWGDLIKAIFAGIRPGGDYKESLVSILYRGFGLILPGIASHSPRDYLNAARLAKVLTSVDYYDGQDEDDDDYDEVPATKLIKDYI